MKPIVGIIGLGIMGSSFATNLLTKGYQVHVYNRTPEKAKALVERGATQHPTPKDLASSVDVTLTSLTDEKAVEAVAFGDGGLLKGAAGKLWIDMSTIDPAASIRHAEAAKKAGVERLDAPVVGSRDAALAGSLIVLVGGDKLVFEKSQNLLREFGRTVIYLDEDGNGHKMKLAVNMFMGLVAVSFSETLAFAMKTGFEPETFVEVINQTAHKNYFTEAKGMRIVHGDYEPAFSLDNIYKDLSLVNRQIVRTGATLPMTKIAIDEFAEAQRAGKGKMDFSIVAQEVLKRNGIE